jgi:hypothetical protein
MDELAIMHESIHAQHRQDISELHWALVQSKAREKAKDRRIADLEALLDQATTPTV